MMEPNFFVHKYEQKNHIRFKNFNNEFFKCYNIVFFFKLLLSFITKSLQFDLFTAIKLSKTIYLRIYLKNESVYLAVQSYQTNRKYKIAPPLTLIKTDDW